MMRYIGMGKVYSSEECKSGLQSILKKYSKGSHSGHWAVFDKGAYVGKALLLPWDNAVDFELGYGVFPEFQKMGYGLAIGQKMLDLAILDGHEHLIATVHRKNKGSIKILKRLGFKYKKKARKYGRVKDLYEWKI